MKHLGSCNFINEYNNRCNRTYELHNMQFRDPYSISTIEQCDLCKTHYDQVTSDTVERVRGFQMKLSNMIAESSRLTRIAKENDTYYKNDAMQQKIEKLKELIRTIQNDECKNYFCNQNLRQLNREQRLFSVSTFRQSGRRQYTFYFCSLKCFNIFKGRCGITTEIFKGQMVLS